MRTTIVAAALCLLPANARAGSPDDREAFALTKIAWPPATYGAIQTPAVQEPPPAAQEPEKDPGAPSAAGAETRSFLSTLVHNLADDVKQAAVPTYLVASYVALSRLHDNRHYLSDVVFGAAIGIIVGRSVTYHGRNHYPVQPAVGPEFLGMTIEWK